MGGDDKVRTTHALARLFLRNANRRYWSISVWRFTFYVDLGRWDPR